MGGGVNTMEATIKNKDRSRWNDRETKNKATIPWETKHNRGWKMIRHDKETNTIKQGKEKQPTQGMAAWAPVIRLGH